MYQIDREYIVKLRREYHKVPEINFELEKTLGITERELKRLHISYTKKYGRASLTATLGPKSARKTIALRADMDALPITEKTYLPFSSKHLGKMHACGHDFHMAMLLGTAKALKEIEEYLPCKVKLIFQAAEEADGGAELMCRDGVMEDVDSILACHVAPEISTGKIGIKSGPVNASSDPFNLILAGKKSHIAKPHLGIDAIMMGNFIYDSICKMLLTNSDPISPILIGIGKIEGGSARNILCDHLKMEGTLRALDTAGREAAISTLKRICKSAELAFGGEAKIEFLPSYPVVYNDERIADKIIQIGKNLLGADFVLEQKVRMGTEDFSFFLKEKPGIIFDLGVFNSDDEPYPLHSEKFNPDEDALIIAPQIYMEYILSQ